MTTFERVTVGFSAMDGNATQTSRVLGPIMGVTGGAGILANVLVAYAEYKGGFLKPSSSSMYKLSANLLMIDTIHLSVITFYLSPASTLQSWLSNYQFWRQAPGFVIMFSWMNMLYALCALAANRYAAICQFSKYHKIWTTRNTFIVIIFGWICGTFIAVLGEIIFPCCKIYMYYQIYSYVFFQENVINYHNAILLVPLNTITSVVLLLVYSVVIWHIRTNSSRVTESIANERVRKRRTREIRYAVHLTLISAVFIMVWCSFETLLQTISAATAPEGVFSVVIFLEILNASANSVVYLLFNREIQQILRRSCCWCLGLSTSEVHELINRETVIKT